MSEVILHMDNMTSPPTLCEGGTSNEKSKLLRILHTAIMKLSDQLKHIPSIVQPHFVDEEKETRYQVDQWSGFASHACKVTSVCVFGHWLFITIISLINNKIITPFGMGFLFGISGPFS